MFVDLQKTFDAIDHEILLLKLNHYGVSYVSNDWFRSYLSNRQYYVSMNVYDSSLTKINCAARQVFALKLPFLIHINDLKKFFKVHHFAEDTNLLYLGKSVKKLNKLLNIDLKSFVNW